MKKILIALLILPAALIFSGCSLGSIAPAQNTMVNATVIRSDDDGATWNAKTKIDNTKTIESVNVLSLAINPNDPNVVYIGTEADGLFVTKNGGENWAQVAFAQKAYGLVLDPKNPDVIYASGVFNNRGKIYKRLAEGQEWKDIYTEPADGTIVSALAIDDKNPQILYAGTSEGVIIKTTDGGATWLSLQKLSGPVIGIAFDKASDAHVFFGVFQAGVFETKDGGKNIADITTKIDPSGKTSSVYTIAADPNYSGVAYVGTGNGIFKRSVDETWSAVNIIESSKAFPIRAIAVNLQNSKEIIYSSAKAIYKSIDGGLTWATFQLDTNKEISVLHYDPINPAKIYGGLRSF